MIVFPFFKIRSTVMDIHSLDFSSQLRLLNQALDETRTEITWLGSRKVVFQGVVNGSISLDALSNKLHKVALRRCAADNFRPEEQVAGAEITRKLQHLYLNTDAQIKASNIIIRIINWIREFSISPYTTRFSIEETTERNFLAFSETRFLQTFAGSHSRPASDGSFGPPYRVVAREDRIRELLIPNVGLTPVTPNMVRSIEIGDSCRESTPCQHNATITLRDGRIRETGLGGHQAYILLEATRGSIRHREQDLRHFSTYSNFQQTQSSDPNSPQNLPSPRPTAEQILSDIFGVQQQNNRAAS